jgi:hypothetical protein
VGRILAEAWSGWSLQSKVIGTSDHFRYDGFAGSALKTSRQMSFSRRVEGLADDPPKIMWTAPIHLGTQPPRHRHCRGVALPSWVDPPFLA